jgi:ribulose-5-phosphate 4-epimerase/fuculose-1-phosphate aldolase
MTWSTDIDAARSEIASACRVMAHRGLVEDILGHISLRLDAEHLLIRCRGPEEAGLAYTVASDIRVVELETGRVVDDLTASYSPPSELPIHTSVLAARPDVSCVVHAHPPDVVVASLAGLPLVPLVGAYNIPAARLAHDGIATHPRSVLIRTDALAAELVASLGGAQAVVLNGHGVVTTGASVPEAVLRALHVATLARLTLAVNAVGARPTPIPERDYAELPDLGSGFNEATLWRHHLRALYEAGRGLPGSHDPRKDRP